MSLRIVPQSSLATSTSNTNTSKLTATSSTTLGAPSAPGLPDKLRNSHQPLTASSTSSSSASAAVQPLSSAHPLEARLAQWQNTQANLRSQILRRNFGIALPLRMSMEQSMVRKADGFRPSVLGPASKVHDDILTGRDAEITWEDVYNGQDGLRGCVDVGGDGAGVGWTEEMERKIGMGKW